MRGNQGINRLARTLAERMGEQSLQPPAYDLGTINADLTLKTDRFPVAIPPDDYLVCSGAVSRVVAGARVLVLWVNDGTDPVIIDTV